MKNSLLLSIFYVIHNGVKAQLTEIPSVDIHKISQGVLESYGLTSPEGSKYGYVYDDLKLNHFKNAAELEDLISEKEKITTLDRNFLGVKLPTTHDRVVVQDISPNLNFEKIEDNLICDKKEFSLSKLKFISDPIKEMVIVNVSATDDEAFTVSIKELRNLGLINIEKDREFYSICLENGTAPILKDGMPFSDAITEVPKLKSGSYSLTVRIEKLIAIQEDDMLELLVYVQPKSFKWPNMKCRVPISFYMQGESMLQGIMMMDILQNELCTLEKRQAVPGLTLECSAISANFARTNKSLDKYLSYFPLTIGLGSLLAFIGNRGYKHYENYVAWSLEDTKYNDSIKFGKLLHKLILPKMTESEFADRFALVQPRVVMESTGNNKRFKRGLFHQTLNVGITGAVLGAVAASVAGVLTLHHYIKDRIKFVFRQNTMRASINKAYEPVPSKILTVYVLK